MGHWAQVDHIARYADFLRHGGNPFNKRGKRLRRRAFTGPCLLLTALHAELVDPQHKSAGDRPRPRSAAAAGAAPERPARGKQAPFRFGNVSRVKPHSPGQAA